MKEFSLSQNIQKIDTKMGTYHTLIIPKRVVNTFSKKHKSRVRIVLPNSSVISCALKPMNIGDYYVYFSKREMQKLKCKEGDEITFSVMEHPNALGVDIPEVLDVFLEQDMEAKAIYDTLTDGRKRTLVFSILRIKDIDKQIEKIRFFLVEELRKRSDS